MKSTHLHHTGPIGQYSSSETVLTYLYPIFGPIFDPTYLSISVHILFLQTYLLTETWDILYGRALMM